MRVVGTHVVRDDGTNWSTPADHPDGGLEWRLRYASPAQVLKDRFLAAGVVESYRALILLPERDRNAVIRDLRAAMIQMSRSESEPESP
jgi:hypothetical protein